ncbi:MAG: putative Ig domain-containing protein [Pseudomonadota bacterium]
MPSPTINVTIKKNNTATLPVADAGADRSVTALEAVTIIGKGTDQDGFIKRYHWAQLAGASVTMVDAASPILAFVAPSVTQQEMLSFELKVTDNDDYIQSDVVDVTVIPVVVAVTPTPTPVVSSNSVPTISGTPLVSIAENTAYGFLPSASDADLNDMLVFSIANKPSWATFDPLTGALTGTPSYSNAGVYPAISISVFDGKDSAAIGPFSVTVTNVNRAPTISGTSLKIVLQDQSYAFTPDAMDSDGDALSFSISGKPAWTSFDQATGKLWGTPSVSDIGSTDNIVITVSDSGMATAQLGAFSLAVCTACVSPSVLYTDLVAGPTSGGENNNGAYLNIFGTNLGAASGLGTSTKVYINNVEVAAYKYLGNAKAQPFASYGMIVQQLAVQVGALGGLTPGVSGAIKVVVGNVASNTDLSFMNQPGDMIYVSLTGDDTTGNGSFAKPYRYVQNTTRTNPAWVALGPGDTIVMRGGSWSDVGWDNRFVRIRQDLNPTAPNGVAGNGYVAFQAYPGEDAVINLSYALGNQKGAFSGPSSTYYVNSHYFVFSGFTVHDDDATKPSNIGAGGPFNAQTSGDHWRIVNNEMSIKIGEVSQKAGAISGGFRDTAILGNYIHDVQGITVATTASPEILVNHGMYFDNYTSNVEVAYNNVKNVPGGSGLQFFGNLGSVCGYPACTLDGLNVHHNVVANVSGKYGLNMGIVTAGGNIYDNIVMHTKLAGIRLGSDQFSNLKVAHNSFFDVAYGQSYGAVFVDGTVVAPDTVYVENNIFSMSPTSPSSSYYAYYNGAGSDAGISMKNNLWFGKVTKAPSKDVGGIFGDPKYLSVVTGSEDLRIDIASPAYNMGVAGVYTPVNDMLLNVRTGIFDIGAYEVH